MSRRTGGPKTFTAKLIVFGILVTFVLTLYTLSSTLKLRESVAFLFSPRPRSTCSPEAWNSGQWTPRQLPTNLTEMTHASDALQFFGFEGCASSREYYWHLAADHEDQWDRFPAVASWQWTPPANSCVVRPFDAEQLVRDMVEEGGWLLIGGMPVLLCQHPNHLVPIVADSVAENHFFSISCLLYPHVRATPNYTENPYFDRAWPQNLYLNPKSPLIPTLDMPHGFNISSTPLVTFRRVDLLLDTSELVDLYQELYSPPPDFSLFSDEAVWSLPASEYMELFQKPLPEANYGTLIVSTGGHWTTTLMSGFRDESQESDGFGIYDVLAFFREAMKTWADSVQELLLLDDYTAENRRRRQVIVRAYLPGHEDCHSYREPWSIRLPDKWSWYNWPWIEDFNEIFSVCCCLTPRQSVTHVLGYIGGH